MKVYGSEAEFVDWRRLLLCLAQPWSLPSPADLVAALREFTAVSPSQEVVGRVDYGRVGMWLSAGGDDDRDKSLKQVSYQKLTSSCSVLTFLPLAGIL